MLKIYECVIDGGDKCFKEYIPAKSKKDLLYQWGSNGEFIQIKDVTKDYEISEIKIIEALKFANFGQIERDIIIRALEQVIELI